MRFGKVLRVAERSRTVMSMDLYNALNSNATINVRTRPYAFYPAPTEILNPRARRSRSTSISEESGIRSDESVGAAFRRPLLYAGADGMPRGGRLRPCRAQIAAGNRPQRFHRASSVNAFWCVETRCVSSRAADAAAN